MSASLPSPAQAPMKLYYNPRSRAAVAKWLLDEAGVDYELVSIDLESGQNRSPELLAVNPTGKLPALVDGEALVFESVAIALYVADRYPSARLAPAIDAAERGRYLSLMVLTTSQLEPAIGDKLLGAERHRARGWAAFETVLEPIEAQLGEGPYLFGEWFTAADVLIGSQLGWCGLELPASLTAYVKRLSERPHAVPLRR